MPYTVVEVEGFKPVQTDANGFFEFSGLSFNKDYKLNVSQFGITSKSIIIRLEEGRNNFKKIEVEPKSTIIMEVTANAGNNEEDPRTRPGITKLKPRTPKMVTSVFGDFNKAISTLPGVSSNNELSSTYSVRGGNFDENLVYVNGMEIYRPFLLRSGQQEGLSFVNPDLVADITFSAGGWQPQYGDKLSSVLAIEYKKPTEFGGSFTAGRLGGALHLENASKNKRLTYIVGLRYKDASAALSRLQEQSTELRPRFGDVQSYITYDLTNKKKHENEVGRASIEGLFSYAKNDYYIEPASKTTTFGAITSQVKRLFVAYDGYQSMTYDTYQAGLAYKQRFNEKLRTDLTLSNMNTTEREFFDLEAGYLMCDIKIDFSDDENLDRCVLEQDIGSEYKYARNTLKANILNLRNQWTYLHSDKSTFKWGVRVGREVIDDTISEYEFIDSADFAGITRVLRTGVDLNSIRYNAYGQHTIELDTGTVFTYGFRSSYWSVNKQFTISPRAQFSWKPKNWDRDYVFRAAAGVYHQPPFYREIRDNFGNINPDVIAQRSTHFIVGSDYKFKMWDRDFKLVSELYYKDVKNVIPYEYEDVKLRYKAHNDAVAYVRGMDFRLSGEFIRDTESWFSLGLLQTRENLDSAFYVQNDGTVANAGWVPRPTDQLVTFGVFFQDQLPGNPSVKMYLNMLFGSGLPFSRPNAVRYKYVDSDGLPRQSYGRMQAYRRIDIGFSKLLIFQDDEFGSKKRKFESLWLGVEVLNIIAANNTISVSWIKDINNQVYGIPNFLTGRLLNVKMIGKF